jgi:predicted GNAT family acetyltransferase
MVPPGPGGRDRRFAGGAGHAGTVVMTHPDRLPLAIGVRQGGGMHTVADQPERSRYEIDVDGQVAGWARYRWHGDRLVFDHTRILEEYSGQSLGSALASGALDDVRGRGVLIVAECPFIRGFIGKHPEYRPLVDAALAEELLGDDASA